jgi:type II secretory ATPase GspE/PulE/Tfp pilus assembly ATPase PilB-like protein
MDSAKTIQNVRSNEEASTRRRANLLHIRYFDTRNIQHHPLFREVFTNEEMYRYKAVVLSKEGGDIVIALTIGTPQSAKAEFAERFKDLNIAYVMISDQGFAEFMRLYDPPKEIIYDDIEISKADEAEKVADISATLDQVRGEDMFNYLLEQAHKLRASDLHLETSKDGIRVRFRIDSVLHEVANLSIEKFRQLASTISVRADISIASPEPQTGHIQFQLGEVTQNMRIETVPTIYGQDIVIRIFTLDRELLNLDNLGLDETHKQEIAEIIKHPSGMFLTVGPTGSGKTTMLYSIISALNTPTRKIVTLEDPVEYTLPGLVQIPVKTAEHESGFADTLRAVLRMDPDVIMVGEIRDIDTARTALQAALSGHLVLSTFHANDAAAALSRLVDMVGDNPLLPTAIRAVLAQRLVRVFDEDTKEAYRPDQQTKDDIAAKLGHKEDLKQRVMADDFVLYKAGASPESPFGYKGQTTIVELLKMDHELIQKLRKGRSMTSEELHDVAVAGGMETMELNGLVKVIEGQTSLEELYRVVG